MPRSVSSQGVYGGLCADAARVVRRLGPTVEGMLRTEETVARRGLRPPNIIVHTANVSARTKMEAGVRAILRLAAGE